MQTVDLEQQQLERAERAKQAEKNAANRAHDVAKILAIPEGRRYLWTQLEASHIFATTFSGDALAGAFSEGERNRGLSILADIMKHDPTMFVTMMTENKDVRK